MESVWSISKLSTESVGSRRELVANYCVHAADADAPIQFRRVGVGDVYWALVYVRTSVVRTACEGVIGLGSKALVSATTRQMAPELRPTDATSTSIYPTLTYSALQYTVYYRQGNGRSIVATENLFS